MRREPSSSPACFSVAYVVETFTFSAAEFQQSLRSSCGVMAAAPILHLSRCCGGSSSCSKPDLQPFSGSQFWRPSVERPLLRPFQQYYKHPIPFCNPSFYCGYSGLCLLQLSPHGYVPPKSYTILTGIRQY